MTKQEHIAKHQELHKCLDELVADYIAHNPNDLLSNNSIMTLIQWSHTQTQENTINDPKYPNQ